MEAQAKPSVGAFILGLPLVFGCLLIGNLLGFVVTSVWGWENLEYEKPGGVALAAIQGAVGAFISYAATSSWLGASAIANFWLKIYVWGAAALVALLVLFAVAYGQLGTLLSWKGAASIAGLVATEAVRRGARDEFA